MRMISSSLIALIAAIIMCAAIGYVNNPRHDTSVMVSGWVYFAAWIAWISVCIWRLHHGAGQVATLILLVTFGAAAFAGAAIVVSHPQSIPHDQRVPHAMLIAECSVVLCYLWCCASWVNFVRNREKLG